MVARVPRDAVRSWGRRFVPAAFMMLLAAVVVGIVAMARDLPGGVSRARDGMHALSGTGRTFETIAACVGWVPRGALVVAVVAVVALPVSLLRRGGAWAVTPPRTAAALLVIAGANLSTQAAKLLLARVLTPEVATLPSGHATLALTPSSSSRPRDGGVRRSSAPEPGERWGVSASLRRTGTRWATSSPRSPSSRPGWALRICC